MRKLATTVLAFVVSAMFFAGCVQNGDDKKQGDIPEGTYTIMNMASEKYADGRGFFTDGSRFMQWSEATTQNNQVWNIILEKGGFYSIVNFGTGLVLGLDESADSVVQQRNEDSDAQLWNIEKTDKENVFRISSKKTGKYLDNLGRINDGGVITVSEETEDESQKWILTREIVFDTMASHYFEFESEGKVLSVEEGSIEYDAGVISGEATEAFEQQWFLFPAGDDTYMIKNLYSSKVLTLNEQGNITVGADQGGDSQKWELVFLDEKFRIVNAGNDEDLILVDGKPVTGETNKDEGQWLVYQVNPGYAVPEPKPLDTGEFKIGTMTCNLWNGNHWNNLRNFGYRTPVLGHYQEGTPKVTDWEIKIAVDNGISFFVPVWYRSRGNEGQPVIASFDHWIKSLSEARYGEYIEYFIMWDNANESMSSFEDEDDLLTNVFPYWLDNYFKDSQYMQIDGRPIVAIFAPSRFINELGGVTPTASALDKMDQMARDEGFEGVMFWGAHHWGDPFNNNELAEAIGMEYSFSYHWPTFAHGALPPGNTFTDEEIIHGHQYCWDAQALGKIPNILTASMGWDSTPWGGFVSTKTWRLSPGSFEILLGNAKAKMSSRDSGGLDSRMMLLDNWNEYGEGHYIFPTEYYGFGYVNAVREVFGE